MTQTSLDEGGSVMTDTAHPLRFAVGSHRAGSGKGCAMDVISWENGDRTITDMPACSDRMLARLVQQVNDETCGRRDGDLLCPACSVEVLIAQTGGRRLTYKPLTSKRD